MSRFEGPPFAPHFPHDRLSDAEHAGVLQVASTEHHIFVPLVEPEVAESLFDLDDPFFVEAIVAFTPAKDKSGVSYRITPTIAPEPNMDDRAFVDLCHDLVAPLEEKSTRVNFDAHPAFAESGTTLGVGVLKYANPEDTNRAFMMFFTPKAFAMERVARANPGRDPESYAVAIGVLIFRTYAQDFVNGDLNRYL